MSMKAADIRQEFLNYFAEREHTIVASSSLVPANDPTLLFTNAGMVQFKKTLLGIEKRNYVRATSSQRCVRAGGKHNDLDNVGYTARHHTFFEMLGNFSFGDYFKREAIQYSWDFLTKQLGLPEDKLWVTVFENDQEAEDIWLKEMNVSPERFSRCGEKDNFWQMGDTGPCGPCTEIFYDHGPSVAGGPPGTPEEDGDRYIEIWNLVFMQYDRSVSGELKPLPKPSVDTGMGLERIAAVMQGVHNNYDIDLFQNLIKPIAKIIGADDLAKTSLRVIADHIRSCAFLIIDGVTPSNEGRGYVLRRIIRRAIRHGNKLGMKNSFFYELVKPLANEMGDAYPELKKELKHIEKVLLQEEEQFAKTLDNGLKIFEQDIADLKNKIIPGDVVFKLYDTYGFPADLTGDIARERGLELDMPGFEKAMKKQRQQSQQASQFSVDYGDTPRIDVDSDFTGYDYLSQEAVVKALVKEGKEVDFLAAGDNGVVVLERTPFYAESGGQVGDCGEIRLADGVFVVTDTQKHGQAICHYGTLTSGKLQMNTKAEALVNITKRQATMLNHSATHLLHAALKEVLGDHVQQKGSLVDPDRLRFDFAHYDGVTQQQLRTIERLVNEKVRDNLDVITDIMTPDEAKKGGAVALFGEKYGDKVRVLAMGEFSKELCGGTHVKRTGDIGFFKIASEMGIASGVRRIEAVTGDAALDWLENAEQQLNLVAEQVKGNSQNVAEKVQLQLERARKLEKEVKRLQNKMASSVGTDLASQAKEVGDVKILAVKLDGVQANTLRSTLDQLKNKLGRAVILLAAVSDGRVNVIAGISKDCIGKVPSPKELVITICGKGGGRDDMAQGGGELPNDLDDRLLQVVKLVEQAIG